MTARLKYLSSATLEDLREKIPDHVTRYRAGDFSDLMPTGEWAIELSLEADVAPLADLDPSRTPEAEIANSRLVWRALSALTPSLAVEEGIWTRLTHVECLEFCRSRWLSPDMDDAALRKAVIDHFFGDTLTKRRDDNAISRLWWNAFVVYRATNDPELRGLEWVLRRADFRSNFVERSLTVSRPALAAGIIRIMQREPAVTASEDSFRALMRTLNRLGGGVVFEAMSEPEIDAFMTACAQRAELIDSLAA